METHDHPDINLSAGSLELKKLVRDEALSCKRS